MSSVRGIAGVIGVLCALAACTPPTPAGTWDSQSLTALPSYSHGMSSPSDTVGATAYIDPEFGTASSATDYPAGAQLIVEAEIRGILGNGFEPHEEFILEDLIANGLTMCTQLVAQSEPGYDQTPLTERCTQVPEEVFGPGGGPHGFTPYVGSVTLGPVAIPAGVNAYGVQTRLDIPFCYSIDGCDVVATTTSVTVRWPA